MPELRPQTPTRSYGCGLLDNAYAPRKGLPVAVPADLPHFLQRREILAYEQRVARAAYAYGVDIRRAAWIHGSRIGDPLIRGVDRRWNATTKALQDVLLPASEQPPPEILEELAKLIRLLRAPLPSLRVLRSDVKEPWPIATPLGTTHGGIHWLVLDLPRLLECTPVERTYVLGWALGHLQCDHGPLFAGHLMAHRAQRSLGPMGFVLRPWARVATFSADRAAMLAVGSLERALEGMPLTEAKDVPWLPNRADLDARRRALEDFARSAVMARLSVLSSVGRAEWSLGAPRPAASGAITERLSHVFGAAARLGTNAAWFLRGGTDPTARRGEKANDANADEAANDGPKGESGDSGDASAKSDAKDAEGEAKPPEAPVDPLELDPALKQRLDRALENTWSLARCDQTLTRRLRLL